MSHTNKKLGWAIVAALSMAAPSSVFATNGYFAHGYGTKNKGLAGAGAALPQDALQAATNPAGMVFLGNRLDLGVGLFSPIREYTASGASGPVAPPAFNLENGTYESDNELFFIPHLGYNKMLDDKSSVGVTVYGNGGMNTEYPASSSPSGLGTYYGGTAGVDLAQLFLAATYARKVMDNVALGVSGIFAYQRFEAQGLGSFAPFSTDPTKLSNNGYDDSTGGGLKVGGQFNAGMLNLGASYQTKMSMSKFDKYAGLFAEGGDFDIPATWTLGAALNLNPSNAVLFDVQRIEYSDVKAVGNTFNPSMQTCAGTVFGGGSAASSSSCLGGSDGAGFGWEDMTVYKLGYQLKASDTLVWRLGYSRTDQPIRSSEVLFNILAPGVIEQHYTTGLTWSTGKSSELNLSLMYAPEKTVSGPNPLAAGGQTIDLAMKQYEFELSYGWKF